MKILRRAQCPQRAACHLRHPRTRDLRRSDNSKQLCYTLRAPFRKAARRARSQMSTEARRAMYTERPFHRLHYKIDSTTRRSPQRGDADKHSVHWLRCTRCAKWRRVDLQTLDTYDDAHFLTHERTQRQEALEAAVPSSMSFLSRSLHAMQQ